MAKTPSQARLPKEQRRRQLLDAALAIVREDGTDALTLARVAERAGVTKPIAYQHFGTREGLVKALYSAMNDEQEEALRTALEERGATLEDVARILSAAYVDWEVACGPEFGAISAALSATEDMEALLQECRDVFVDDCRRAFAPFVKLSAKGGEAVLLGLVGAAEMLSHAAAAGRMSRREAVDTLARIMVGTLAPLAATRASAPPARLRRA